MKLTKMGNIKVCEIPYKSLELDRIVYSLIETLNKLGYHTELINIATLHTELINLNSEINMYIESELEEDIGGDNL